jgi:AcrR family transcriptional regulator
MKRLKESTRKKLLLSAINEFSLNGYAKTNVDTVSKS